MSTSPAATTTSRASSAARPSGTRSWTRLLAVGAAAAAAAAALVLFTVPATSGVSWGSRLAEANGQTATDHYDTASATPAAQRPAWMPNDASDVTVKRPGPAAGDSGADRDAIKVDAVVPYGWSLPAECRPAAYSQPFDGGGRWPLTVSSALSSCPDPAGVWSVLVQQQHVYAWR